MSKDDVSTSLLLKQSNSLLQKAEDENRLSSKNALMIVDLIKDNYTFIEGLDEEKKKKIYNLIIKPDANQNLFKNCRDVLAMLPDEVWEFV